MADFNVNQLRDQILEIVRKEGPVLPAQISQKVVSNILFTSAMLSDLVRQNQVKISKAKIGSSPVYYVKGQEYKLQILYKYLGEKPRKIYDIIKEKKILRDKALEPWQRVAVREIQDFATMLTVNFQGGQETFWKWYQTPDEEAKQKILTLLKQEIPQKKETKPEPQKEEKQTEKKENQPPKIEAKKEEKPKKLSKKKEEDFFESIKDYFEQNKIKVIQEKVLRKGTEFEFFIEIPSVVGNLKYHVMAKNKKKVSDAELVLAYSKGEREKMSTLFLSPGELTKKARKYLDTHLKGLIFRKI